MDMIISIITDAYKLAVNVPVFGIGVLVGAFGYRYLLKKNPTMLQNLVAKVAAEAEKLASK